MFFGLALMVSNVRLAAEAGCALVFERLAHCQLLPASHCCDQFFFKNSVTAFFTFSASQKTAI
jgi:hypothetical protein